MEHLAYYRSLVGAWAGEVRFAFTGWPTGLANRVHALVLRLLGHVRMETTLAEVSDTEFAHTTRVRRLGLTLFRSEERILLDPDGTRFVLRGLQRDFPGWPSRPLEAHGSATRTGATYHFEILGAPMEQVTAIVPDGLALTQVTAFSRAETVLGRR